MTLMLPKTCPCSHKLFDLRPQICFREAEGVSKSCVQQQLTPQMPDPLCFVYVLTQEQFQETKYFSIQHNNSKSKRTQYFLDKQTEK